MIFGFSLMFLCCVMGYLPSYLLNVAQQALQMLHGLMPSNGIRLLDGLCVPDRRSMTLSSLLALIQAFSVANSCTHSPDYSRAQSCGGSYYV